MLPGRTTASCLVLLIVGTAQHRPLHAGAHADAWWPARVQLMPMLERPFVYVHQRKTGGSSIRHAALAGAKDLYINGSAFIPCEQSVACATFTPYLAQQRFSIYAGHFNWHTVIPDKDDFACLTSFRHPLDRATSCLHFRFPDKMHRLQLQNMSRREFRGLLRDTHHDGNTSCNNEAVIMMLCVADARMFEALMRHRAAVNKVIREAIANMENCVVLVHASVAQLL